MIDEHVAIERTITLPLEAFYYLLVLAFFAGMIVVGVIAAWSTRRG